jgi:hypothetical protein
MAAPSIAPLSPHWAFVIQLRERTPVHGDELCGRVEHIVSGQTARFASTAELLRFIERVLGHLTATSGDFENPEPPCRSGAPEGSDPLRPLSYGDLKV